MKVIKRFAREVAYRVVPAVWRTHNAAIVLTYHSISEAPLFGTVRPRAFEAQMRHLAKQDYNVVSLSQLDQYRAAGLIPPKTIAITFDDGYTDNLEVAYPMLKRYGFPATIFVITSLIGKTFERRGTTFQMLSEEQLRELHASGLIDIEPHTVNHQRLPRVPLADAEREMRQSREVLENLLGSPRTRLAYPFGSQSKEMRAAAHRAGITSAYTVREGFVEPGDDPLLLRRNGINATVSLAQFAGIVRIGLLTRRRLLRQMPTT